MPPYTLFRYISGRMAMAAALLFVALSALIMVVDLIESLRFASKVDGADFMFAVKITLLRTLSLTQAMTPFIFLFGGLWMYAQLNRRSELSVMRSSGLSIWKVIGPAALIAVLAGIAVITVIDPLSTRLMGASETLKNDIRGKNSSLVQVFGDGLWLRQREGNETLLINARELDQENARLTKVRVWRLSDESMFSERIDAETAVLSGRSIEMQNAVMTLSSGGLPQKTPLYSVPTKLSIADFRDGAPPPETISIWALPRFIELAEAAGLPTIRYDIRYHDLWSMPVKLFAMVLIAAMFSMRPVRSGGALQLVLLAVVTGFALYFLSEIALALGESGAAPIALAAWTPTLAAATIAISGLLHLEDG